MLDVCLPLAQPQEAYFNNPITTTSSSAIIKLRNHNLGLRHWGIFDGPNGAKLVGSVMYVGLPFVHVVKWNDRYFLHNGYHRAYGLAMRGAVEIPCLYREVASREAAGIRADGGTFDEALMTSANPPTLAHFIRGRALPVSLRIKSRVIHVTWHEYSVPDEYE
jgi:hypothetical protein